MENNFGIAWIQEPIKTIRRSYIKYFGTPVKDGDKQFFDRRGAIRIPKGQKSAAEDSGSGGFGSTDSLMIERPNNTKTVDAQKAMDAHFGWVYACVKAISDEMANIDWRVYVINGKGEKEETEDHDILSLLDGVNEQQTGPEFKKMLASHLELTGNAFIYLFGIKDFDQKPTAMYLLNPGRVKIKLNKTIYPYQINQYEFIEDGRTFTFQPYEIIHLKYPDPNDTISGLGTVQGIAEWIDNDNYAMEYNRKFFKNGARMSGVFETDMNSVEQTQRLKIAFEEQFQGVSNAYKSMILPKGVKWVPTQVTAKDMDFANLLDATAQRILAGFRVSKTILGTAESETNRATAETADYVFAKRTIKPKMQMIVSYLNEFLAPRYGEDIFISFTDPVPEDISARSQEMTAATGNKPILTQNEARQEFYGLPALDEDGADSIESKPAQAFTLAAKDKSAHIFIRKSKMAGGKKGDVKFKTQFSRNKERRKEMAKSLGAKLAEYVDKLKKKNLVDMTDEEYISAVYIHSKARIDEYSPRIYQEILKINSAQEKQVKKNLDRSIKSHTFKKKDIDPSKLLDLEEWINITVNAIKPIFTELFSKEALSALRNIGQPDIDLMKDPNVLKWIDNRMDLLARSYNQSVTDKLTVKLNEGLAEGLSRAELSESISGIYEFQNSIAADRVAKTETVAVSNMANKDAWKAAGTVKTVRWYTSEKDNVCPFCMAMKGKTINIDDNFFNKGETITGQDGNTMSADYSAIGGPPLHVNCGCFIRPDSFTPIKAAAAPVAEEAQKDIDEALAEIKKLEGDEK